MTQQVFCLSNCFPVLEGTKHILSGSGRTMSSSSHPHTAAGITHPSESLNRGEKDRGGVSEATS